jgi:hypothetical protein
MCQWNIGQPKRWGDDLWYDEAGQRHYVH